MPINYYHVTVMQWPPKDLLKALQTGDKLKIITGGCVTLCSLAYVLILLAWIGSVCPL